MATSWDVRAEKGQPTDGFATPNRKDHNSTTSLKRSESAKRVVIAIKFPPTTHVQQEEEKNGNEKGGLVLGLDSDAKQRSQLANRQTRTGGASPSRADRTRSGNFEFC